MRKIFLLPLLAGLAGCGNYFSVRVPYLMPDMPGVAAARPALEGLYVTVKAEPPAADTALGSLAAALLNKSGPEFRPAELARRAAKALTRPGSRVCAWRVDKSGTADTFAPLIKPSGLLAVNANRPSASSKKEERTSVYYDKKKQKQTVKSQVWVYSASIYAEVKLYSWPAMELLDSWADTFSYAEDRFDGSKDAGDWYADSEEKLFGAVTARLVARYAGHPVDRFRPVFSKKGDKESEEAGQLARHSRWEKAEEIWLRRETAGGWRDSLGLAVSAELKKDYPAAEARYREAQARSAGDKEAGAVRWAEIYRDLQLLSSTRPARGCGGDWFWARTAVLPFSDETTSVDGPPLVRQLVHESLKSGGYDLVPLEETDEVLRRHGYSDGGQLAAAKPEQLAAWLGAGRLVYGDLTDFGEIMAGVYNRRMVKGSVRIWETGAPELSFEESVVKVKTPKNFVGGMIGQLAKGLVERIKNKPLAYESGLFSQQVTENLPNSVKR